MRFRLWSQGCKRCPNDYLRAKGSVEDGFECAMLSVAKLLGFDHFFVKPLCCPSSAFEVCIVVRIGVNPDCAAKFREVTFVQVERFGIEKEGALFACHGGEGVHNSFLQVKARKYAEGIMLNEKTSPTFMPLPEMSLKCAF